jgi:AcrR family transcriptional regulator
MSPKEKVRLGGRSARIQAEVHKAVQALAGEVGRDLLTVPMIAARAGVTPSTIYRRWGELSELLADVAVQRMRPVADPDDTGAARSDLETWVYQYIEEMGSPAGVAMLRDVLGAGGAQPSKCSAFTLQALAVIAERALARGENPVDVDEVVDRVVAPIVYHILFADRPIEAADGVRLLSGLKSLASG